MKKAYIVLLAILSTITLCNADITLFWESPITGEPHALYNYGTDKIKYIAIRNGSGTGNTTFYDAENSFTYIGTMSDTLYDGSSDFGSVSQFYFDTNHDNRPEICKIKLPAGPPDSNSFTKFIDMIDGTVIWQSLLGYPVFIGHIGADTSLKIGIHSWASATKLVIYDLGISGSAVNGTPSSPVYNTRTTIENAPNPFRETTNIRFALSKTSTVKLDIFNQIGQKITTLKDGKLNSGEHVITWNANGVASGLYLYRLLVDGQATTEKTIIIR